MGRPTGGRSGKGMFPTLVPEVRSSMVAHMRLLYGSFPSGPKRQTEIAAVESGAPVVIDSATLCCALSPINTRLARQFGFRSDPDNVRRFLLDEDNELTEITPRRNDE